MRRSRRILLTLSIVAAAFTVPPPEVCSWPPLLDAGDVLDGTWGRLAGLEVLGGSEAATQRYDDECVQLLLLADGGDPVELLGSYLAQLDGLPPAPGEATEPVVTPVPGCGVLRQVAYFVGGGGPGYQLSLFLPDDATPLLRIRGCDG